MAAFHERRSWNTREHDRPRAARAAHIDRRRARARLHRRCREPGHDPVRRLARRTDLRAQARRRALRPRPPRRAAHRRRHAGGRLRPADRATDAGDGGGGARYGGRRGHRPPAHRGVPQRSGPPAARRARKPDGPSPGAVARGADRPGDRPGHGGRGRRRPCRPGAGDTGRHGPAARPVRCAPLRGAVRAGAPGRQRGHRSPHAATDRLGRELRFLHPRVVGGTGLDTSGHGPGRGRHRGAVDDRPRHGHVDHAQDDPDRRPARRHRHPSHPGPAPPDRRLRHHPRMRRLGSRPGPDPRPPLHGCFPDWLGRTPAVR